MKNWNDNTQLAFDRQLLLCLLTVICFMQFKNIVWFIEYRLSGVFSRHKIIKNWENV